MHSLARKFMPVLISFLLVQFMDGAEVDFARQIKPILKERCFACHGALKQESSLRLDSAANLLSGGDSGPAIVPHLPDEGELISRVSETDETLRMPPDGAPLSRDQIDLIQEWIRAGATVPKNDEEEFDPRKHWAFVAAVKHTVPANSPQTHPIDALLHAERLTVGGPLSTTQPVDDRILLRRLYLDLVGVPPTLQQVESYSADTSVDRYAKRVDQLLASSHYGERWGRHWMDVWRYTDWYGLGAQLRYSQKHIWHWRDWIIESLNADLSYAEMIRQMLAADELYPDDRSKLRATGFLARNYYLFNRTTWLDSTIEHTSKAFFGLTVNCSKCHDHKYDPISQVDYYAMRAIFEPHQIRLDPVPGEMNLEKNGIPRAFDAHPDADTFLHIRGNEQDLDRANPIVPASIKFFARPLETRSVDLPVSAANPALQEFVLRDMLGEKNTALNDATKAWHAAKATLLAIENTPTDTVPSEEHAKALARARLDCRLAELTAETKALSVAATKTAYAADYAVAVDASDREERVRAAARAAFDHEHARLQHQVVSLEAELAAQHGTKKSEPAKNASEQRELLTKKLRSSQEKLDSFKWQPEKQTYTSLRASRKALEGPGETDESRYRPYPKISTGRRTALANWITDRSNPLSARVAVNHVWLRHMGQPLVESMNDFGRRTKPPVQQKLLDWLAIDFMDNGWSMKRLHRLIVTSNTYRLSGATHHDFKNHELDPGNKYYWCRTPARMEAQLIRDSLLHLAGTLEERQGGPTVNPTSKFPTFRRSLYFTQSRDHQHEFVSAFDDADIFRCYRREESIIPQQALALANSQLTFNAANKIAVRLSAHGDSDDKFIQKSFKLLLCRPPSTDELLACRDALAEFKLLTDASRVDESAAVVSVTDASNADASNTVAKLRTRTNLIHSLLNHNDFITIR